MQNDRPSEPADIVEYIHRDPEAFVVLGRKTPDRPAGQAFENGGAIRLRELRTYLPQIGAFLLRDAYFSVNGYGIAGHGTTATKLPWGVRQERFLRTLTAVYADIDCGRPDSSDPADRQDWFTAAARIFSLADSGDIPQPSLLARSGRGGYVFWLLRDRDNPEMPQRAFAEKVTLCKAINKQAGVVLRTNGLPADKVAIDAARVVRFPGSIHSGVNRPAVYNLVFDAAGQGFTYTLDELAAWFGVAPSGDLPESTRAEVERRLFQRRMTKQPGSAPQKRNGLVRLNALRAQDLLSIATGRGGIRQAGQAYPDGHVSMGRRFTIGLLAAFLRGSGETQDSAIESARSLANGCIPPFPSDPSDPSVESIVSGVYKTPNQRRFTNQRLCQWFGVTAESVTTWQLQTILPDDVTRAQPSHQDKIKERRNWLREHIERTKKVPSVREIEKLYAAQDFVGANRTTAAQDLQALGHLPDRSGHKTPRRLPGVG